MAADYDRGRWSSAAPGRNELVAAAPSLIPIFGHRFVIDHGPRSVLSIVGTDAIATTLQAGHLGKLPAPFPVHLDPADLARRRGPGGH